MEGISWSNTLFPGPEPAILDGTAIMMMDEQCITVSKLEVSGGMLPQEIF